MVQMARNAIDVIDGTPYLPGLDKRSPKVRRSCTQGTDSMVTEGRYRRSGPICESCLRVGCLMPASSPYCYLHSLICDTATSCNCLRHSHSAEPWTTCCTRTLLF